MTMRDEAMANLAQAIGDPVGYWEERCTRAEAERDEARRTLAAVRRVFSPDGDHDAEALERVRDVVLPHLADDESENWTPDGGTL